MRYIYKSAIGNAETHECKELDLDTMQALVGGYIEMVSIKDYAIICNEDGKLLGLDENIAIADGHGIISDIVVGDIIIAKVSGEDLTEMSNSEADRICTTLNNPLNFTICENYRIIPVIERR